MVRRNGIPKISDIAGKPSKRLRTYRKRLSKEEERLRHLSWLGAHGYIYARNRYYLLFIKNEPCKQCGSMDNRCVDHIQPRGLGGGHELENLQALCRTCHKKKTKIDVENIKKAKAAGIVTYGGDNAHRTRKSTGQKRPSKRSRKPRPDSKENQDDNKVGEGSRDNKDGEAT